MFLNNLESAPALAKKTSFSIFAVDPLALEKLFKKTFKTNVIFLRPDEKTNKISVEAVRNFTNLTEGKSKSDHYFVVLFAEKMNEAAENAFLKNLEEPKEFHHFVLITTSPSALLPTVLSRAQLFYLKETDSLGRPVEFDEKTKALAKRLIVADTKGLIELASEISKKKDNARDFALNVVAAAIEILYKSYFATGQEKFLKRLPNLLKLHENLSKNGHIKLHFVADMLLM